MRLKKLLIYLCLIISSMCINNKVFAGSDDSMVLVNYIPNVYYSQNGPNGYHSNKQGIIYAGGRLAYCLEPEVLVKETLYDSYNGINALSLSNEQKNHIQLLGHYGYEYPGHQTNNYYLATQELIWEYLTNISVDFYTGKNATGTKINIENEKQAILTLVNRHYLKPSFNLNTVTGYVGETITLNDTNNALSKFNINYNGSHSITKNGNSLNIKLSDTKVGTETLTLSQGGYDNLTTIVYKNPGTQTLASLRISDPALASLRIVSLSGKVTIEKQDNDTKTNVPQGVEATLKGATYGIYDESNKRVGTLITDENGRATSSNLPSVGNFYILEEANSLGYQLDPTKYWFKVDKNNLFPEIKVYEKIINRDIEITKVYADDKTSIMTPESNAEFGFYNSKGELVKTATTDQNGRIKVNLVYGKYTVKQLTTTLNYEKVDDFELQVYEMGDTIYKVISNAEITAKLKIIKIDKDTKEIITMAGIRFKIFDINKNEYVCQTITYPHAQTLCEFETDENGVLITPYELSNGKYRLEELDQNLNGYLWNKEPLEFEIGENSNIIHDDNYGFILETKFENKEVKGQVNIIKYGEKLVFENNSYYYKEVLLPNVVYELYANKDIYSANHVLKYKKGALIKTIVTDENGMAKIEDLYLGSYFFREKSSSNNNMIDQNKYYFELKYKDQYTEIITCSFSFKNYLPKGTLEFTKTDLVTGKTISNTKIQIFTENDKLIYTGITDENGKIVITDLPTNLKMYIKELEPATDYIISDEKIYFEINDNNQVVKVNMKNEKIEVPDTKMSDINWLFVSLSTIVLVGLGLVSYGLIKNKE